MKKYYSSFGVWIADEKGEYRGVITFDSPSYNTKTHCRLKLELKPIIHKSLKKHLKGPTKVYIEQTVKGPDTYEQFFEYGYFFSNGFVYEDEIGDLKSVVFSKDKISSIKEKRKNLFIKAAPVPEFREGESGTPEICDDKQSFVFKINGYKNVYDYGFKAKYAIGDILKIKNSLSARVTDSEIVLSIIDIKCKRLQDITPQECIAYGVDRNVYLDEGEDFCRKIFSSLWNSKLSSKQKKALSWEANPWVLLYEFESIKK